MRLQTTSILFMSWMICIISHVGYGEKHCIGETDPRGLLYVGKLSTTRSGVPCRRWDAKEPHSTTFRQENVSYHHNYCRNPDGSKSGPWCYTTDPEIPWDFCDVGFCTDLCGVQEVEPSFTNQPFTVINHRLVKKSRFRRILGGDKARNGSWPWLVEVKISYGGRYTTCGGVLIDKSWVITAAHCLDDKPRISQISLKAESHSSPNPDAQIRFAKAYFLHEEYKNLRQDIALIQLKVPFRIDQKVRTVCLPQPNYIVPPRTFCVVAGFGRVNGNRFSDHLRQAVVPVHSYKVCVRRLGNYLKDWTQMCAGWSGQKHDTCKGDSGGPLLCLNDGRWTVQGITSWSYQDPCEDGKGYFGSYTRVSKYTSWISDIIDKVELRGLTKLRKSISAE